MALAAYPALWLVLYDRLAFGLIGLAAGVFGTWGIVAGGVILRLAYLGTHSSDPMLVVDAARDRVLSGLSPYGIGYAESVPAGAPFPYGPLMLVDSVAVEFACGIGILVLLAWFRRPITLAIYAGAGFSITLAGAGHTEMLPTFFLAAGILLLPRWWGGALVGLAVAVKPYTVFFLPLAFSLGSLPVAAVAAGIVAIGFLPALFWGGFFESIAMLSAMQGSPWTRYLSVIALGGLRWPLLCCAGFAVAVLNPNGVNVHYLVPLIVTTGILIEGMARERRAVPASAGGTKETQATHAPVHTRST